MQGIAVADVDGDGTLQLGVLSERGKLQRYSTGSCNLALTDAAG